VLGVQATTSSALLVNTRLSSTAGHLDLTETVVAERYPFSTFSLLSGCRGSRRCNTPRPSASIEHPRSKRLGSAEIGRCLVEPLDWRRAHL
jgi:hypothetical protein